MTSNAAETESALPRGAGNPARRALAAAGYRRLDQLTGVSEAELLKLHGVGPKAIDVLRRALAEQGLAFAPGSESGRSAECFREAAVMSGGGLSTTRLERMRAVMAGYVERGELPGLVTLLSRRGEVYVEALGTMALGGAAPMRRDTIFRIASMTKPVAAVAALILLEECRLRLDEPVDRLLPELADRQVLKRLDGPLDETVPAERPITVRDLLTLRMGFGYLMEPTDGYPIQQAIDERRVSAGPDVPALPPDEWLRALASLPLLYQPGERWLYETGMEVLSVLLARAADQPLETLLSERIFQPLGMRDTGFSVPAAKLDRLAALYQPNAATGGLDLYDAGGDASRWSAPPLFPSAAGGLVSTVDDYLVFGQMLLNKGRYGRERILSRPSVELMTADQLTADQRAAAGALLGEGRGWGFGVSVVRQRNEIAATPGRFGWDGGYGTSWASDPAEEMVAILMTQRLWDDAGPLRAYDDFWTAAYQAIDD